MTYCGIEYSLKNRPALDGDFLPFAPWRQAYLARTGCLFTDHLSEKWLPFWPDGAGGGERLKHCKLSTIPKRAHKTKPPESGRKMKLCLKSMQ